MTALRLPQPALALLGAATLCALAGAALAMVGPVAALAPAVLIAGVPLLRRPGLILALLLAATVVFEDDQYGFLPITTRFYFGPPSPIDLLIALLALSVAFEVTFRRRPIRLPEPFTVPLALLAMGITTGMVTGYFGGADAEAIFQSIRILAYLVVVPLLAVNVLTSRADLRTVVIGAGLLATYKGFEGSAAWLAGAGRELGGRTLTYYHPTANFLLLLFILTVACAVLARVSLPWWVYAALPFVVAAFTLSFRRNWWIAALLALILTLFLTSGLPGRRLILPGAVALGVAAWIAMSAGGGVQLQGSVVERARSLAPSRIEQDKTDRYRLDELRNVREELSRHPITGLGIGVKWTARYPLPTELEGGRYYTHIIAFWYWLNLGLIGLLAYLSLMAATGYAAFSVWRTEIDPLFRVVGLAALVGIIALMVAETTGSFTGVDPRFTVVLGALIGWLSAARRVRRAELADASAGTA